MGQFKNEGDIALALAEECAEVIQIITKKFRFNGNWDETPPNKEYTRWSELKQEMEDVMFQWERLKQAIEGPKVLGKINLDGYGEPDYDALDAEREYMRSMELDEQWVDYQDDDSTYTDDQEWPDLDPEFVVVSTSYKANETAIFQSDENGNLTTMFPYTTLSQYWLKGEDRDKWEDHDYIMSKFDGGGKYIKMKDFYPEDGFGPNSLWGRK